MELNDIQEMTFVDIEKTLAGNEKKILSNLSKIQKLSDENAKLVTESKMLNEQKTQKLLQEMQNRILDSVEILLAPPKAKSQKKDKTHLDCYLHSDSMSDQSRQFLKGVLIVELNDIQEMTLADIEKTLAGNEKRILSNLSRAQKLLEENKRLITKSTALNEQKTQKLLQEMQDRFFTQAKAVEGLLGSTGKRKSQKNISATVKDVSEKSKIEKSENRNSEKSKIGNSENLEIGNSENLKIEKSENQNSENAENRKSDYDPEMIEGLKKIATVLGLPEDSSVIEIRRAFETNKNSLPLFVQNKYEKILRKFEKE